jgi:glyoxylate/hydroxypyruvate reductase
MALLFSVNYAKPQDVEFWRQTFKEQMPEMDFRAWPDVGNPEDIEFALTFNHQVGDFQNYPNLKAILSLGAGVDHILRDPDIPEHIYIVRLVDNALQDDMTMYVIHWVIHYHRNFHMFPGFQQERKWDRLSFPETHLRKVGVMGLGQLGALAATKLRDLGFDVAGWSRTAKEIEGVQCFHGEDGLTAYLNRTEINVLLMPATPATTGIINKKNLAAMPKGSYIINPGRGPLIVEADLIEALDSGHLARATLDVFPVEPLPTDSAYWGHPHVAVTPHAAGPTNDRSAARTIIENIRKTQRGEEPGPLMDRNHKY